MDMQNLPPIPKIGLFTKLSIKLTGADKETLLLCPEQDLANIRAIAEIMLCTWLYQAALFTIISQRLFGESEKIRPELVAVSIFIASFILCIDSYMVMRSGWHLSGIEELKRGGLDISGGPAARIKAGIFLTIRIILSVCIAQLTAIFLSILIFSADINARTQNVYQQANARSTSEAVALVDAEIGRATDAVTVQKAHVGALTAQVTALRQNEINPTENDPEIQQTQAEIAQLFAQKTHVDDDVRKAESFASDELAGIKGALGNSGLPGDGPRRRAAMEQLESTKNRAQDATRALEAARARLENLRKQSASTNAAAKQQLHDQLLTFDATLAAENDKLSSLNDQLTRLNQGRSDAIRNTVEKSRDYVPLDNGLLAQITALEHMAENDSKIAAVILLLDLVSFGFELAAVLAKITSFVPTTFAALLARDAYLQAVRIVNDMTAELDETHGHKGHEVDNLIAAAPADLGPQDSHQAPEEPDASASQPFKRPRGRPRKSVANEGIIGSSEQEP